MRIDDAARTPLWWDVVPTEPTRSPLEVTLSVDVVVVGAGFTGLWCAYHLAGFDPDLTIAVIEVNHVGFGASGRNGGWCHAEYPLGHGQLVKDHGDEQATAHMEALFESVDEVGRIVELEAIKCDYVKGGVLTVARSELQDGWAKEEAAEDASHPGDGQHLRYLDRVEAASMLNASGVVGAVWHPHGAAVHPAKLVHGLAEAAERRGVMIYENSEVVGVAGGRIVTDRGAADAGMVVLATEGYTSQFPGRKRDIVPLYSHMIATEPLPDAIWDEIGLATRVVFSDFRNLIIYGQRTADGRFAFGGRGAPYHFGSRIEDGFDMDDGVHRELVRVLLELFPQLEPFSITHRWGGPLGVSRDWRPAVVVDRSEHLAWAGGYVGDGVATAQLAGRTLAELIVERDTERTSLPWVRHTWPKWEFEPLRWIGINFGLNLAKAADRREEKTGKASRLADMGNWLRGKRN